MKTHHSVPMFVLIACAVFLNSCLLPGMIPLNSEPSGPMPVMETNSEKVIEVLNSNNYIRLDAFVQERYTEEDFSRPGNLTFTATIPGGQPIYFSYGWCTTTEEILNQNFEHIDVKLYFNENEVEGNVIHPLAYTRPDGLRCLDHGVLMTEWPAGEYKLAAVATFNEKINDGLADFEAGDYAFEYNVTVEESANNAETPAPSP